MPYKNKEDKRRYQRNWVKKRREEFFKDKKCIKCESDSNLELHHRDPNVKENHKIWSWSRRRINEELKKCDILCNTCHIQFHSEKKRKGLIHGTETAYKLYKCRCDLCKKAKALSRKKN